MDLGLTNRIALVCGASRGLGRAVARELALEGCRVVICARDADRLGAAAAEIRAATGAEVLDIAADVSLPSDRERLVSRASGEWGGIDILVTNTGGPPSGPFEDHHPETWNLAFDSLFMSVQGLCELVLPRMKAQRWGRIINITSVTVKQPLEGLILSNSIRAAVAGLAKSLAVELGPHNILVNNVCPGYTRTERLLELAESRARATSRTPEDILEDWRRMVPLARIGEPEELAALVAFLASGRACYITGTTIPVDGGFVRGLLA